MNIFIGLGIIFAVTIICFVVGVLVCKGDFIPTRLIPTLGVCVAIIYLLVSVAYTTTLTYEEYVVESTPIISLNDNDKLSGAFVLGSGAVKETTYYVYNYKLQDGGIKRDKIEAKFATIYETDDSPHIDVIGTKVKESEKQSLLYNIFHIQALEDFNFSKYNFYIPKGSVITDFEIDSE